MCFGTPSARFSECRSHCQDGLARQQGDRPAQPYAHRGPVPRRRPSCRLTRNWSSSNPHAEMPTMSITSAWTAPIRAVEAHHRQTMTIEDGSSLSQSQTHLQVFQNLVEDDADMLRDIVNNQLIPRMVATASRSRASVSTGTIPSTNTPEQQVHTKQWWPTLRRGPCLFRGEVFHASRQRRNNMPIMDPQEDPDDNSRANERMDSFQFSSAAGKTRR
jgi:hypothetical protein